MTISALDTLSTERPQPVDVHADVAAPGWQGLYTVAAGAALLSVVSIVVAIVAHVVWPPPDWSAGAAVDWFARFQDNWFLGLLGLDLMIVIGLVLGIPVYLALYVALRHAGESTMAIATALALIGTVLHLVSNTAFQMFAFSEAYAAATTEAQQAMFLAAGEATLAGYYGTAFHVSYVLGYLAKLMIGAVMLRSVVFSKATAYVSILTGAVGLGFYVPTIGLLLSIVSVLLIADWNVLIAYRLFRLSR